jgi:hypothetical protein
MRRIYNIDDGMGKFRLCALRVAAREPAAQGRGTGLISFKIATR